MLAAVGDLMEDIVVHVRDPLAVASDTESVITRRRGGSAANVCAAAAVVDGRPARFIGQIGDDPPGRMLADLLAAQGVELAVHRRGRTGTVVVLVDPTGERTMLPDPGTSRELADPEAQWLDDVGVLHIPAYSLLRSPMDLATATLARWTMERSIPVTVDASSAGLLRHYGVPRIAERLRALRPRLLLVNELEAATLGADGLAAIGADITMTKHGAGPVEVDHHGQRTNVPAVDLGPLQDTTAAGDSFAAGAIGALLDGADPVEAARHGHRVAATVLTMAVRP